MNRVEIIIVELKINDVLKFCWLYSCRSYMYMLLHLVAKWIHWRSYQYLYKVWIEEKYHWSWELIVILNRWELLLGHVGIWDVWVKCQLVNHCQGAITVLWSLLNSPLTPIVTVCSLTQNLLSTLISLKRNATRKNSKFYFGRYYNISLS